MPDVLSQLHEHARRAPWHPCLILRQGEHIIQRSYAEFVAEVDMMARRIDRLGLAPGSLFCIAIPHGMAMYLLFLAAMRAGLVPSFLAYATPKQQADVYWTGLADMLHRTEPHCIVVEARHVGTVQALAGLKCLVTTAEAIAQCPASATLPDWTPPEQSAITLVQHSSGTTGSKKGVPLTHAQLTRQIAAYSATIDASPHDRVVSWLPLYHDMGLITGFLLPLSIGATIASIDAFDWLARPALLFETIELFQGTLAWMPNFAFAHLVRVCDPDRRHELSSMRAFISCSEPCKPATMAAFADHFGSSGVRPEMLQTCYAMAEAVFCATQSELGVRCPTLWVERETLQRQGRVVVAAEGAPGAIALLSCGRPIAGIEVGIDVTGAGIQGGGVIGGVNGGDTAVGEIVLRGSYMFDGYYRNDEATRHAVVHGWYHTGDMGFLHAGALYVSGRQKEIVIVHGRNFYAHDVEEEVGQVAGVKPGRVAVVGRYDPASASEQVTVFAELNEAGDPMADAVRRRIRQHVFDRLELTIRTIELFDPGTLVKTTSGKIARAQSAQRIGGNAVPGLAAGIDVPQVA